VLKILIIVVAYLVVVNFLLPRLGIKSG